MKKGFLHKFTALLLAVVLTGCAVPAANSDGSAEKNAGKMEIVDTVESQEYPFAMEFPAIDADVRLPEDVLATSVQDMAVKKAPSEVKSVWISFLELERLLGGKSESQFRRNINTVFDNVSNFGLNTVVVQVRPYADAFYQSKYFPWSFLITGTEGKDPGFDPLEIMVTEARARGLRIEAWVNPYRIRPADRKNALASSNQAKKWLDAGDDAVISYNGVISYNPASTKAQTLIVNGVVELAAKYDIDAIHIDDYFYPTTDKAFDKKSYSAYQSSGGKLSLDRWRRSNVEKLIKKIYAAVKETKSGMMFGISPQSSVDNNYNAQYLDVKKIASTRGYCDYICPQIYFGFENGAQPFAETLATWDNMVTAPGVKLYVGLAAYKVGKVDSWAGAGKNEWTRSADMLKRMTQAARQCDNYGGIVLYRYDFLFNPEADMRSTAQKEANNLKAIL